MFNYLWHLLLATFLVGLQELWILADLGHLRFLDYAMG